jgi:hypothetical protein
MAKFKNVEVGTIALIQQKENGRVVQIGITQAQSDMLQMFLGVLSEESKLVEMPEEYDLTLMSEVNNNNNNNNDTGDLMLLIWYIEELRRKEGCIMNVVREIQLNFSGIENIKRKGPK